MNHFLNGFVDEMEKLGGAVTDFVLDRHPMLEGAAGGALGLGLGAGLATTKERALAKERAMAAAKRHKKSGKSGPPGGVGGGNIFHKHLSKDELKKMRLKGRIGGLVGALGLGTAMHGLTQAQRRATARRVAEEQERARMKGMK